MVAHWLAELDGRRVIVEVPASHVSFVSQPDAATQLILQAVNATAASRT